MLDQARRFDSVHGHVGRMMTGEVFKHCLGTLYLVRDVQNALLCSKCIDLGHFNH